MCVQAGENWSLQGWIEVSLSKQILVDSGQRTNQTYRFVVALSKIRAGENLERQNPYCGGVGSLTVRCTQWSHWTDLIALIASNGGKTFNRLTTHLMVKIMTERQLGRLISEGNAIILKFKAIKKSFSLPTEIFVNLKSFRWYWISFHHQKYDSNTVFLPEFLSLLTILTIPLPPQ